MCQFAKLAWCSWEHGHEQWFVAVALRAARRDLTGKWTYRWSSAHALAQNDLRNHATLLQTLCDQLHDAADLLDLPLRQL